jgi:hypothetical protein
MSQHTMYQYTHTHSHMHTLTCTHTRPQHTNRQSHSREAWSLLVCLAISSTMMVRDVKIS